MPKPGGESWHKSTKLNLFYCHPTFHFSNHACEAGPSPSQILLPGKHTAFSGTSVTIGHALSESQPSVSIGDWIMLCHFRGCSGFQNSVPQKSKWSVLHGLLGFHQDSTSDFGTFSTVAPLQTSGNASWRRSNFLQLAWHSLRRHREVCSLFHLKAGPQNVQGGFDSTCKDHIAEFWGSSGNATSFQVRFFQLGFFLDFPKKPRRSQCQRVWSSNRGARCR